MGYTNWFFLARCTFYRDLIKHLWFFWWFEVVNLQRDSVLDLKMTSYLTWESPLLQLWLETVWYLFNNGSSQPNQLAVVPKGTKLDCQSWAWWANLFLLLHVTVFVFSGTFRNRGKTIWSSFKKIWIVKLMWMNYAASRSDRAEREQASWVVWFTAEKAEYQVWLQIQHRPDNPPLLRIWLSALFILS